MKIVYEEHQFMGFGGGNTGSAAMSDRQVGAHNSLAVWLSRHGIDRDSLGGRITGLVGTVDRLSERDTSFSVCFFWRLGRRKQGEDHYKGTQMKEVERNP